MVRGQPQQAAGAVAHKGGSLLPRLDKEGPIQGIATEESNALQDVPYGNYPQCATPELGAPWPEKAP